MKGDKKDLEGEESEIDLEERGKLAKNDKQGYPLNGMQMYNAMQLLLFT